MIGTNLIFLLKYINISKYKNDEIFFWRKKSTRRTKK